MRLYTGKWFADTIILRDGGTTAFADSLLCRAICSNYVKQTIYSSNLNYIMKTMRFTGIICATVYTQEAEASAKEASLRYEQGQRAMARISAIKAAEEAKKAKKAAKRQVRDLASSEERETLHFATTAVYKIAHRWERKWEKSHELFNQYKELIFAAIKRQSKIESALLGETLWATFKDRMKSHSYEDNWEFGELKHALQTLREDLIEGADEEKNPVVRHAYWWAEKFIWKNYSVNSDIRRLRKELNYSEK